jgi:ABC-2 type transport system permease protein
MIGAVLRTGFMSLRRDRGAWVLSFVLPIAFFSIFAIIFGQQRREGMPRVKVAVVDEDGGEVSSRLLAALLAEASLEVRTAPVSTGDKPAHPYDRETAEAAVHAGDVPVALIIPRGFSAAPLSFGEGAHSARLLLLNDSSDPVAPQVVAGLLQKAAMMALPDVMAEQGMKYLGDSAGGLSAEQRASIDRNLGRLREATRRPGRGSFGQEGLVAVEQRDVVGEHRKNPYVAFYAAGIGVMFLLFTASGAGGALLDEVESGTLDRVLCTKVSMTTLLLGKLLYLAALALGQLVVMFTWGALVFHLEFVQHLGGFFAIAVPTAIAAAAFGLVMATACRTRSQLGAFSTLVILIVSAVGGSMFPRFLMPESLQRFSLFAFNSWALDGFTKVFWREEPLLHLLPQIGFLLANALVFFALARRLARRWEMT